MQYNTKDISNALTAICTRAHTQSQQHIMINSVHTQFHYATQ